MSLQLAWLDEDTLEFPDPATALKHPNGLLAAGGDLSAPRLLKAYQLGIFPWFSDDQPPLWWSPDPRMVLFPAELHISRSLAKVIKSGVFTLSSDTAFAEVLKGCAGPRKGSDGTWLSEEMQEAYGELFRLGHAHSVETWSDGQLVGGLYGIALDGIFYGESMFSHATNASKVAMAWLCQHMGAGGFRLLDCQVANPHLSSIGSPSAPAP